MANPHIKLEQSAGGIRCVAVSDVGMRRASNQDSMAVALAESPAQWQSHGHLLLVADGMGAHAAGELASQIAADTIPLSYHKQPIESPSEAIFFFFLSANSEIYTKGQDTVDFQGMGTTCSSLVLLPCGAIAAHVGDSRVYRLRCDQFEQLTFDHSLVWEMAAAGQATEDEVPAYVPKNVITRSLGPHPTVAIDVEGPFPLQSGDRFLLCSDGLTGPLKPELIGMVLGSLPLDDVGQTLIDLANLLGGPDNITVVLAEVVDAKQLGAADLRDAKRKTGNTTSGRSHSSTDSWWDRILAVVTFGQWGAKCCPAVIPRHEINRQGKAPYRQHASEPNEQSIAALSDIVHQLEDLQHQREWNFDWKDILADRDQAHAAIAKGEYTAAVVCYSSSIRQLMQALRETRSEQASDSTIDLGRG